MIECHSKVTIHTELESSPRVWSLDFIYFNKVFEVHDFVRKVFAQDFV